MEENYAAHLLRQRQARVAHVRAWRKSGWTQQQYCRANALNATTFSVWLRAGVDRDVDGEPAQSHARPALPTMPVAPGLLTAVALELVAAPQPLPQLVAQPLPQATAPFAPPLTQATLSAPLNQPHERTSRREAASIAPLCIRGAGGWSIEVVPGDGSNALLPWLAQLLHRLDASMNATTNATTNATMNASMNTSMSATTSTSVRQAR